MAEQVTLSQQTASLKDTFHKVDVEINSMFEELESVMEPLSDSSISHSTKFDILIGAEYLLVKIRTRVLRELSSIQSVFSMSTKSDVADRLFKERYNTVILMCQRLNEFRDDMLLVQRSMWARNNGRL